jgi:uncharacterized membrane protein
MVKDSLSSLTKALESRAAALIIAVLVLYGAYDLANKGIDSLASKLDVVSKELGGIRSELAIQSVKLTELIEKVRDHEDRLRRVERRQKAKVEGE